VVNIVRQQAHERVELKKRKLRQIETSALISWENQHNLTKGLVFTNQQIAETKPNNPQLNIETIEVPSESGIEIADGPVSVRADIFRQINIKDHDVELSLAPKVALESVEDKAKAVSNLVADRVEELDLVHNIFYEGETLLEANVLADEMDIGIHLTDLEEGLKLVEAENVGHLLLEMFLEAGDDWTIVVNENPRSIVHSEITDNEGIFIEAHELQGLSEKYEHLEMFNSYLNTLEPVQAEEVKDIIEVLRNYRETAGLAAKNYFEKSEIMKLDLYKLTERLFKALEIEPNEKLLIQLVEVVVNKEIIKEQDTSKFLINNMYELDAQVYKAYAHGSLIGSLSRFIMKTALPQQSLGRYTLQASMT
jgi:hypothetical protein